MLSHIPYITVYSTHCHFALLMLIVHDTHCGYNLSRIRNRDHVFHHSLRAQFVDCNRSMPESAVLHTEWCGG